MAEAPETPRTARLRRISNPLRPQSENLWRRTLTSADELRLRKDLLVCYVRDPLNIDARADLYYIAAVRGTQIDRQLLKLAEPASFRIGGLIDGHVFDDDVQTMRERARALLMNGGRRRARSRRLATQAKFADCKREPNFRPSKSASRYEIIVVVAPTSL